MINAQVLAALPDDAWIVNACRGEVIDEAALIAWKTARPLAKVVLDVWHNEPHPAQKTIDIADIATPHIAGYSMEGKCVARCNCNQHLQAHLNSPPPLPLADYLPETTIAPQVLHARHSHRQSA